MPSHTNPQNLNRYSYVTNNPLKYTDPTGHKSCYNTGVGGNCEDSREEKKLNQLFDYMDRVIKNKKGRLKAGLTSLTAMTKVVNRAAQIYGNDWDTFLNATSLIFTGVYQHGAGAMLAARRSGNVGLIDGDSGFNGDFRDYTSQQVRHFWAGFATAANPTGNNPLGPTVAMAGNVWHEISNDTPDGNGDGATVIDFALTNTAIDMAKQVGDQITTPGDLAAVLQAQLGEDGPGYIGPPINTENWYTPWD